jgi:hypothetical protein
MSPARSSARVNRSVDCAESRTNVSAMNPTATSSRPPTTTTAICAVNGLRRAPGLRRRIISAPWFRASAASPDGSHHADHPLRGSADPRPNRRGVMNTELFCRLVRRRIASSRQEAEWGGGAQRPEWNSTFATDGMVHGPLGVAANCLTAWLFPCFGRAGHFGNRGFRLRASTGEWVPLEMRALPTPGSAGALVVSRDVRERYKAEEALRQSEALYRVRYSPPRRMPS